MRFDAVVERRGTGTVLEIPFDVRTAFGRARAPVRATVNGFTFRTTVAAYGGRFYLGLNREVRESARMEEGERVRVDLERDDEPRVVSLPGVLAAALEAAPDARAAFERLSYTHRREYVRWIEEAKRDETRRRRAERAVELGARAVMLNVFAQGLASLQLLRQADLGVPLFAHRVGAAMWMRDGDVGVSPAVVAELTRLCGADYVQVGSFTGKLFDREHDVRAEIAACRRELDGAPRSTAVLGGGVGPDNAAEQVARAGVASGLMVLLGSAAYLHPGGVEEGVRATVEAVRQ